ncbi:MAG: hypothetical protein JKY70_03045 [Mucilaginibacter sp.]|nr:hypothetical protein [Mucilaginibacter sp.]
MLITTESCKKNDQLNAPVMDPDASLTAASCADHLPLTVVTIAGKYNTQGYVDGPGVRVVLPVPPVSRNNLYLLFEGACLFTAKF